MEIQIASGVKNPLWSLLTMPSDVVTVTTYTPESGGNKYPIDQVISSISPIQTPVTYSALTFTRSLSQVSGQNSEWTVAIQGFRYTEFKVSNGNIILTFPRNVLCNPLTSAPVCTVTVGGSSFVVACYIVYYTQTSAEAEDEACQSLHTVQFSSICATSSNCNGMTTDLSLKLSTVRNYLETGSPTLSASNYFAARVNNLDNSASL